MRASKLHLKEIDMIIYFPRTGNEGRSYEKYGVAFRDRRRGITQPGVRINLRDVLSKREIVENYPHTIGYYIDSIGRGKTWAPKYLATRSVANVQEFYHFLRALSP